jgi:ABC-type sugar transport system substrate-binding protein
MTRFFFLGSLVLSLLFLSGCGGEEKAEVKGRIGMTCMDLTNPFFKLIANVMTEEAAKHGYEVTALSDESARDLVTSHLGSDNFQGGVLAGESMMKALGNKGKVAVVSLPEVSSCILRVDGFKKALADAGSPIEIVTELSGKGSRDAGYAVTTDILQAHPDITGIFAINDPSALGAHAAVVKAGKQDQITIVAFDASPAGKQAVFEKKLYDTPQQFPRKMAVGTVAAFLDYLAGKDVPKKTLIPCAHYRYEDSVDDESRIAEQW